MSFEGGHVLLTHAVNNEESSSFPTRFAMVEWDDRQYLIADSSMPSFVLNVRYASEDAVWWPNQYFLKGVEQHNVKLGRPQVPAEYHALFELPPSKAQVVAVNGPYPDPELDYNVWETDLVQVRLDSGTAAGFYEEMPLFVPDIGDGSLEGHVLSVDANSSVAMFEYCCGEIEQKGIPSVGTQVIQAFRDFH